MTAVNVSESVAASADKVWKIISDFGGIEPNEMIASCTLKGEGVGAVRTIGLNGGGEIIERLESHDDGARVFSYAIINDCPLPVANYLSTVKVSDAGSGSTTVNWSSTFEAVGAPEADVVKLIQGVYKGGIQRVRGKLGV
ncbi:MAG: SRPBCC family protein [Proteobacteria bacterium]|nr:SRPBCC family protein [Pseudomonadota bacterium]